MSETILGKKLPRPPTKSINKWLPRLPVVDLSLWTVAFVWWGGSFSTGFFQDDYLLLWLTKYRSITQLIEFWIPIQGFPYRPVGTFLTYYFLQLGVGLNPIWFHLVFLVGFAMLLSLIFRLATTISDSTWAFIWTLWFAVSATHFMSLYWLASFYFTQGVIAAVASLWCWQLWRTKRSKKYGIGYLGLWLLAVVTNDALVFLPAIALLLSLWQDRGVAKHLRAGLLLSMVVSLGLIGFRLTTAGTPSAPDYQIVTNPISVAKTTWWYGLRTLGLPEAIRAMPNPSSSLFLVGLSLSAMIVLLLVSVPLKTLAVSVVAVGFWWAIGLQPFSLLPYHLSPYYLGLASVAVIGLSRKARPICGRFRVGLAVSALILWSLSQAISLEYFRTNHWVIRRSKLAQEGAAAVTLNCTKDTNLIVIPTDPTSAEEMAISLHGYEGAAVLCQHATIQIDTILIEPSRARTL